MNTTVRLMTQIFGATPLGAGREGHILSEDGGPLFVVEGRAEIAMTADGRYARPFGHDVTQFSDLRDAVEYTLRRGWNSSAITQWARDYGLSVAVTA